MRLSMTNVLKQARIRFSIICSLLTLVAVGCVGIEVVPENFPYEAMLRLEDFEGVWTIEARSYPEIKSAISSHTRTFRYGESYDAAHPAVVHQVTVYPNSATAIDSFDDWLEIYALHRSSDPEILLEPDRKYDLTDARCERLRINGNARVSCFWVQQHGRYISFVQGLIDADQFTLEQFIALIRLTEERLHKLTGANETAGIISGTHFL